MAAIKKTGPKKPAKKVAGAKKASKTSKSASKKPILKRAPHNPIISPKEYFWESKATFNPAAFEANGKIHLIYRAIGNDDSSVLGYASSLDGHNIQERLPYFIYRRCNDFDKADIENIPFFYASGGGWNGGCEDPRLTLLDGRVYLLYTAFDGWGSVRIAMTSISLEDFIAKRFNWKEPVLISPPGQIHKNWVLFPEKIKGPATAGASKYAILHSVSPKIMIDYFKSLDELDGKNFIHSVHRDSPLWKMRDRLIRGVGPTPIKTKYGWLILYHKMEPHDTHRYKLWAMILDSEDPTKILYDTKEPILEPDLWYENEGYKEGVIYSCGAVVKDDELFVYYGGADKVSCVAVARLDLFLKEIIKNKVSKLKKKE
ncbi:MAG: hypothetical protein WD991_02160 [Candidatus Paceibacterota bacterium]